jgi:hypothetical protein
MAWRLCPNEGDDSPWPIFERVIRYPELAVQEGLHGEDITWAFFFRLEEDGWTRDSRMILGTAQMPRVSGSLAGLFDQLLEDVCGYAPDFLILLNEAWWMQASDREREILVFHELSHCGQAIDRYGVPRVNKQTGRPILAMVAHDLEEFNAVAARYGEWKSDITAFREALEAGPRTPNSPVMPLGDLAELDRGGTSHSESPDDVF